MFKKSAPAFAVTCVLALLPGIAGAALGETEASVRSDMARLKASSRITTAASYTMHELTLPTGTIVHEYLDAGGTVFAVSWRGPFKPDLPALLGSYFDTYASAPRSAGSSRSRLAIDQGNLVVRAGGHQRAFTGLAYVPQLLPPGLSVTDLR